MVVDAGLLNFMRWDVSLPRIHPRLMERNNLNIPRLIYYLYKFVLSLIYVHRTMDTFAIFLP